MLNYEFRRERYGDFPLFVQAEHSFPNLSKLPIVVGKMIRGIYGSGQEAAEVCFHKLLKKGEYHAINDDRFEGAVEEIGGDYAELIGLWLSGMADFVGRGIDTKIANNLTNRRNEPGTWNITLNQARHVLGLIARFQETSDTFWLTKIESSDLLKENVGIFGLKDVGEFDSNIQQSRLFLLGIPGLTIAQKDLIVSYIKQPPNTSRRYIGKLPAAIIEAGIRLGLDWRDKASSGWPTPAEPGPKTNIQTEGQLRAYYEYALHCAEKGWTLPALDVLTEQMGKEIERVKQAKLRPGWNRPLRMNEAGDLENAFGEVIKKAVDPALHLNAYGVPESQVGNKRTTSMNDEEGRAFDRTRLFVKMAELSGATTILALLGLVKSSKL